MTLVLASNSASRKAMLEAAGVSFTVRAADIDERAIEAAMAGAPPSDVALALARAKALAVSRGMKDAWVLGSDSLVEVAGRRFDKPRGRDEAAAHLAFFSGKAMDLHSAAVIARNGHTYWECADRAELRVRHLTEAFIAGYLNAEWPAVEACVGVFRIEGAGVQLFDSVAGSHFTVLGMPLLPVLGALRERGELTA
jgi:septum formation protein